MKIKTKLKNLRLISLKKRLNIKPKERTLTVELFLYNKKLGKTQKIIGKRDCCHMLNFRADLGSPDYTVYITEN